MSGLGIMTGQTFVEEERVEDALILKVSAERIDATNAVHFRSLLESSIKKDVRHYILDFSQVKIIDSSGFSMLIMISKKLPPEKRILLVGLNRDIFKLFEMLKLDALFDFFDTPEDALENL